MTYTISAFSSRHPVAPLGYSAPWPAATIEVNVVKCCWKLSCAAVAFVECSCGSSCHGRWVWGMALACKGSAGAPCLHVQLSSHSLALHGGLPCLGSGAARRPRRSNAPPKRRTSAAEFGGSKTRLAIRPKRTSKRNVSRAERNLKLDSSSLSYDFLPLCSFRRIACRP
jgi:hypothetical protein